MLGQNLRNRVSEPVFVRIGALPEGFNLYQFVAAYLINVLVEGQLLALSRVDSTRIINKWAAGSGQSANGVEHGLERIGTVKTNE